MIRAAISWHFAGPLITPNRRIIASDYVDILGNQVHPMIKMMFLNQDANFQDDDSPIHIARRVQSWFEEHEDELQHLPWPTQ